MVGIFGECVKMNRIHLDFSRKIDTMGRHVGVFLVREDEFFQTIFSSVVFGWV
jgi:hypothetical protein